LGRREKGERGRASREEMIKRIEEIEGGEKWYRRRKKGKDKGK